MESGHKPTMTRGMAVVPRDADCRTSTRGCIVDVAFQVPRTRLTIHIAIGTPKDVEQKDRLTRTGFEGWHGVDPIDNGVGATAGTQVELGDGDGAHVRSDSHPVIGARPAGAGGVAGLGARGKGEFGIGSEQRRASTLDGGGTPRRGYLAGV